MPKQKTIHIWAPDLKPPKDFCQMHIVEILRPDSFTHELDRRWVEYRLVAKNKKKRGSPPKEKR